MDDGQPNLKRDDREAWQMWAARVARHAHEHDLRSERGLYVLQGFLEGADVLVIFNNHPYAALPSREQEVLEMYVKAVRNCLRRLRRKAELTRDAAARSGPGFL